MEFSQDFAFIATCCIQNEPTISYPNVNETGNAGCGLKWRILGSG